MNTWRKRELITLLFRVFRVYADCHSFFFFLSSYRCHLGLHSVIVVLLILLYKCEDTCNSYIYSGKMSISTVIH